LWHLMQLTPRPSWSMVLPKARVGLWLPRKG
jgi:hypothetical protein